MATPRRQTNNAVENAEEAVKVAANSSWMEKLARFGYFTKGLVYVVVGLLAALAGFGMGGETTDMRGSMRTISAQPFGKILLGAIALGLVGYVAWRLVQAVADADGKGSKFKGIALRIGYGFSGLVHAGLAFTAVKVLLDARDADDSGNMQRDWTARLMAMPFGNWVVMLVGASVIGFGIYQLYKGFKAKFRKHLKLDEMSEMKQKWAILCGRLGYAARGIVFIVIGIFLTRAALRFDPTEAQGLEGALDSLAQNNFGPWILGLVAAGLAAYGIYMMVEGFYRRIAGS